MSSPLGSLRTFIEQTKLPILEFDKAKVQKRYGRVSPLCKSPRSLQFNLWGLAHAVKKADCARWPYLTLHPVWTAGFLLEHAHLFDWNSENLRLGRNKSDFYADFSRTSIVGRIAQGLALLFLEDMGYPYAGHFGHVRSRLGLWKYLNTTNQRKGKTPDFIVENGAREWALAESKGGFLSAGMTPKIKRDLKAALVQLNEGTKLIKPQPPRSFAVGTYLREVDDSGKETSLVAFADPAPDEPQDPVEIPRDAVRRANYASWLSLMGFDDAARRLWTMSGEAEQRTVPAITVGERQYAVTVTSVRPQYERDPVDGVLGQDVWDWLDWPIGSRPDGVALELVGLDVEVIQALEPEYQNQSRLDGLMELEPFDRSELSSEVEEGVFCGSVLSDRSLLGELRLRRGIRPEFEQLEMNL